MEREETKPRRLHLEAINASLKTVEIHWPQIDDELDLRGIGRRDTPFTALIRITQRGNHPLKIAAEIYVSILGYPLLYIVGNHRTGSLIADWISVYDGFPAFVLSVENAIAYFAPSAEIKKICE